MTYNYNTEPVENTTGGTGKLRIRADFGSAALPAGGVKIRISGQDGEGTVAELKEKAGTDDFNRI